MAVFAGDVGDGHAVERHRGSVGDGDVGVHATGSCEDMAVSQYHVGHVGGQFHSLHLQPIRRKRLVASLVVREDDVLLGYGLTVPRPTVELVAYTLGFGQRERIITTIVRGVAAANDRAAVKIVGDVVPLWVNKVIASDVVRLYTADGQGATGALVTRLCAAFPRAYQVAVAMSLNIHPSVADGDIATGSTISAADGCGTASSVYFPDFFKRIIPQVPYTTFGNDCSALDDDVATRAWAAWHDGGLSFSIEIGEVAATVAADTRSAAEVLSPERAVAADGERRALLRTDEDGGTGIATGLNQVCGAVGQNDGSAALTRDARPRIVIAEVEFVGIIRTK